MARGTDSERASVREADGLRRARAGCATQWDELPRFRIMMMWGAALGRLKCGESTGDWRNMETNTLSVVSK